MSTIHIIEILFYVFAFFIILFSVMGLFILFIKMKKLDKENHTSEIEESIIDKKARFKDMKKNSISYSINEKEIINEAKIEKIKYQISLYETLIEYDICLN